jgi:hypothetical protein
MSKAKEGEDDGGLMYQQLRKFINVIVSKNNRTDLTHYRMNLEM